MDYQIKVKMLSKLKEELVLKMQKHEESSDSSEDESSSEPEKTPVIYKSKTAVGSGS